MTSFTVRTAERAAVMEILEQDHPSAEKAAEAVIKTVVGLLAERAAFGIRVDVGPTLSLPFGPWWHGAAVKSVVKSLPGASVHTLYSPSNLLRHLDDDALRKGTQCSTCSHPLFAHGFPGRHACVVPKCKCKGV